MEINLDVAEGTWFPYFESHIDLKTGDIVYHESVSDAKVQIRSVAPFIEQQLKSRKRKHEYVHNPKTRAMEYVTYFEEMSFDQIIAELDEQYAYGIMDFEGFVNSKTKETIPCTRETKIALRRNEVFARFFERCQQIIHGDTARKAEEAEKN